MQLKLSKTTLQFIMGTLIVSVISFGCNDTSSKTDTKKDSTVVVDSTKMNSNKMDNAKTRPIVNPPDQPAAK